MGCFLQPAAPHNHQEIQHPSRAAALDLGSNTLRLLVAEVDGGGWRALERGLATPRLGRGLRPGGPLAPEARRAARERVGQFTALARSLGARRVSLAATQACRLAVDGPDFVAELGREFALDSARVLDGLEEARLSRLGVMSRLEGVAQGAILADVGGGSSEIVDLGPVPCPALSLPLGAVGLSEAHLRGDPPGPAELKALDQAVRQALLPLAGRRAERLVASAGTASTLASLVLGLDEYQPERINNLVVPARVLDDQAARLAALPLAERRRMRGLEPERADIIIAGLAILRGILEVLGLDRLTTMDAGLLEGILLDDLGRVARNSRPLSQTG